MSLDEYAAGGRHTSSQIVNWLLTYRATDVIWQILPYVTWEYFLHDQLAATYTWMTEEPAPPDIATRGGWSIDRRGFLVSFWHLVAHTHPDRRLYRQRTDGPTVVIGEPVRSAIVQTILVRLRGVPFPTAKATWLWAWVEWVNRCNLEAVQQAMAADGWPCPTRRHMPRHIAAWVRDIVIRDGW